MTVESFNGTPGRGTNEYIDWVNTNPEGFVINSISEAEHKMHRAPCKHFEDRRAKDMTGKTKHCCLDLATLDQWAALNLAGRPADCASCHPREE